jgi:acetyltransferase-like isoleucine patch superfamily enzyme
MEKIVKAFFGLKEIKDDAPFESEFTHHIAETLTIEERLSVYERFKCRDTKFDSLLRRIILRSLFKNFGNDITVSPYVSFTHPETIELGNGVFLGNYVFLQGRQEGYCKIGDRVWIGPYAYFDARSLIIENDIGIGPGVKILGSEHTGKPKELPIIQTDLVIKPVKICRKSDIGINAVILPGVTIGESSIVGAGAVVTKDVDPYTVVAGVPAKFLKKR